jgi:excisionase family DNA binding protein
MQQMIETVTVEKPREGLATIAQAQMFLQVSRPSIYSLSENGTLPARRLPGLRSVRIPWSTLESLAK